MGWLESLDAELPPQRDDEPQSLRQDILDELSDHLQSALNRELHRTGDMESAKQNVLNKFGNPKQIARKLWLGWMKEKIMSQRITLAAVCVMACVGLAGLLMAFQMMQNNQALNQQMLAQMTSLLAKSQSDSGKPTDSLNWTEFKVKVVRESAEGPAVKGATVSLQGVLYGSEGSISLTETTNSEGLVNFGPIQVGRSTVSVALPSGFLSSNTIYVRPSQEMTEVIVAPVPPKPAEVQVLVEWPTSIKSDDVWMICDFAQIPREVEEFSWLEPYRPTALAGMSFPGGKSIAISRDGQMYEIKQKQKQFDGVKGSVLLLRDFDESTKSPGMLLKRDQLKTNDGEFELLRCGVFVKVPSKMKALLPIWN